MMRSNDADEQTVGHINNTYNTAFWTLILKGGLDAREAEQKLSVRFSASFFQNH
jgi:tRNA(His) 5'-end guanylyltransferase